MSGIDLRDVMLEVYARLHDPDIYMLDFSVVIIAK